MYTQCPDCDTAFRVTAPILQQAAGRVVCAGCGLAFNALEKLTEDPPAAMNPGDDSKGVLETLDELTGPHQIRIEDTGVEWRVIDEDDPEEDFGMQSGTREPDPGDTGTVRWYLEDTPGEVPGAGDEAAVTEANDEIAGHGAGDGPEHRPAEPQVSLELAHAEDAALPQRYDDNTPLPEDFVEEREPPVPQRRAEDRIEPRSPEADEAQVDLALGEPADWMDLLDEVGTARNGGEAVAGKSDDLGNDAGNDAGNDIDDSGHEDTEDTVERPVLASPVVPNAESPAGTPAATAVAHAETGVPDDADVSSTPGGTPEVDESFPSDIDTQFDLQAIEMGIDLTGNRDLLSDEPDAKPAAAAVRDSHEARIETPLPVPPDDHGGANEPVPDAASLAEEATLSAEEAEERNRERAFDEELATAYAAAEGEEAGAAGGKPAASPDGPAVQEHFVPAPTEEELTVNMQIDQDLIRLAEQQNVFTSGRKLEDMPLVETIIMEGETVRTAMEAEGLSRRKGDAGNVTRAARRPAGELLAATPAARPGNADLLVESRTGEKDQRRGGRRRTDPPSYRLIAGVAVLAFVLAAQVVHAYRASLATHGTFDRTVGSLYRLLGQPVTPDWDVKGWQFEATSGSTDETGQLLTISSRILNGTARSLPYPLLHLALTDRWEETIGSKVVGPAEYLGRSTDAASLVAAGETFVAIVAVEAPSPDATGFKLNVCYREPGRRLRCATEDFKK